MPTNPCRHLHTSGRQCGSPALRGEPFCFYHHTARKPMPKRDFDGYATPQLPAPEDFLAIQRGIGEVLRLLALDSLTDRRAQSLLRGLAAASANLARHHRREEKLAVQAANPAANTSANQPESPLAGPVTDYINDPIYGTLALDQPAQSNNQQPVPDNQQPIPDPIPLLTPDPSPSTSYDEAKFTEIHQRFDKIFRDKLQRYEHQKSLELETLYDTRHAELQADFDARLATHLQTSPQTNQDFRTSHENHDQQQHHLALAT